MGGDPKRYLRYLKAEREAAHMYRALAELAPAGDQQNALLELADIEDRHARHWTELLEKANVHIPEDDGSLDPSSAEILQRARQFSLDSVLGDLERAELDAQDEYDDEPDAPPGMSEDERLHAQVLQAISTERSGPASSPALVSNGPAGRSLGELRTAMNKAEPWHRTDKSGSLRAAVFGVSDGLVSNTALVMGFAGSGIASQTVLFAGIAGLLAGAFSMAAGEYVSVASQRDIFEREISLEKQELEDKPLEEQRELELIYRAKGLDRETAKAAAERIMADPEIALDTLAREELGLDPDDLGSPYAVAASSFVAFAVGASVPAIAYLFAEGTIALVISIAMAAIALIIVGGVVGKVSGAGIVKSAARQLIVGSAAAGVTYVIGKIVGVGLS